MPHKIKLKLLCSSCMFNVSHYQYRQGQPLNCIKFKSGWQSYFFTLYHWVKTYSKSEQFLWIAKLFCFFSALAFPPPPTIYCFIGAVIFQKTPPQVLKIQKVTNPADGCQNSESKTSVNMQFQWYRQETRVQMKQYSPASVYRFWASTVQMS